MSEPTVQPLRFSLRGVSSVTFARYPVEVAPADGTMAIVTGEDWQTGGVYEDGEWRTMRHQPFKRPVLFWTIMEDRKHG